MNIIVLDRDGVINQDSDAYIKSPREWVPIPGSLQAIALLGQRGFRVTVATNQSGLARGLLDGAALAAIHRKMYAMVEARGGCLDGVFFCPHDPAASCSCRKPATGLLHRIEAELRCDLAGAYLIGDSLRDLQAAIAHGMRPLLVRTGKGRQTALQLVAHGLGQVPVFDDLYAAVQRQVLGDAD